MRNRQVTFNQNNNVNSHDRRNDMITHRARQINTVNRIWQERNDFFVYIEVK